MCQYCKRKKIIYTKIKRVIASHLGSREGDLVGQ